MIHYFDDEDNSVHFEKIKKQRRAISDKRSHTALNLRKHEEYKPKFSDEGLNILADRGIISSIVAELRSGKEAVVYYAVNPAGQPVAVKLYKELRVRSFKKEGIYTTGRFIGSQRLEKAIAQRSETGIDAQQTLWIQEEYRQLRALAEAGVRVPRPYGTAGRAIAMEFIGKPEGDPAPRLADIRLSGREAENAYYQAVNNLLKIVAAGKIHGDYSCYNILWQHGEAIVIDFPQTVEIYHNHNAKELLRRDAESLCRSFERHGVRPDPDALYRKAVAHARARDW